MLKHTLEKLLGIVARAVVKKYRPKIVAITGSVGKTTTRAACVAVLSTSFRVRGSLKNYNNELGVPISILGCDAPGHSIFKWIGVFLKGVWLLLANDPLFPQVLVLEMGADHPGDIEYLMSIAPPDVGVVTAVSAAHTEYFNSIEGVLAEKKVMITTLAEDHFAIINGDDENLKSIVGEVRARLMTLGFSGDAHVQAQKVSVAYDAEGNPEGTHTEIRLDGREFDLVIPRTLGVPVVYAALAGVSVGRALGLESDEIQKGLMSFQPPAGRLRILDGIKHTTLIDDTYNSSPHATHAALDALASIQARGHKIVVLGDMLELGALTEEAHREIGRYAAKSGITTLITVGPASRFTAEEARGGGLGEDHVFSFDTSAEAGSFLQERLHEGDTVLIKGSQGVRCERVVKEIMAEPLEAEKLIVRQSKEWV
jgi:UDP-N-acetylmuramoyl-tripeptide--D-alanyl-D-alanine ligase